MANSCSSFPDLISTALLSFTSDFLSFAEGREAIYCSVKTFNSASSKFPLNTKVKSAALISCSRMIPRMFFRLAFSISSTLNTRLIGEANKNSCNFFWKTKAGFCPWFSINPLYRFCIETNSSSETFSPVKVMYSISI